MTPKDAWLAPAMQHHHCFCESLRRFHCLRSTCLALVTTVTQLTAAPCIHVMTDSLPAEEFSPEAACSLEMGGCQAVMALAVRLPGMRDTGGSSMFCLSDTSDVALQAEGLPGGRGA